MKEENLGVALIHEICIVCGKETNEANNHEPKIIS